MFSMCSELTPRARILDTRIPQLMQPCSGNVASFFTPKKYQLLSETDQNLAGAARPVEKERKMSVAFSDFFELLESFIMLKSKPL